MELGECGDRKGHGWSLLWAGRVRGWWKTKPVCQISESRKGKMFEKQRGVHCEKWC